MKCIFRDRQDAGRRLAARLTAYAGRPDVLVLGLPRGGVPVAFEVAQALAAPLDAWPARKLGVPGWEELAFGAIALGGSRVLNPEVIAEIGLCAEVIATVTAREEQELARRDQLYRGARVLPVVQGRIVILVDDGLATGATMRAALAALRPQHPARLVVAVPVGAAETCARLRGEADEVVCLATPTPFHAIGLWYADFEPTSDDAVRGLLAQAAAAGADT